MEVVVICGAGAGKTYAVVTDRNVDRSLTTLNLTQETSSIGSYYRARASELSLIYGYTIHNKRLSLSNKIFR